ncbi:MAG: 30S ribosome-binding factor RbfA [Patescibacteria group bacterium]
MTDRQEKLNSILLKELAQIINQEIEFPKDILSTLTHVRCAANLDSIRIFVSCLPFDRSKEIINILQKSRQLILEKLNSRIRLRRMPNLIFKTDECEEFVGQLNKIEV